MTSSPADPKAIILELNAQGKDARDIAVELASRGVCHRHGCLWSADMVASILRIMGETPIRNMTLVSEGAPGNGRRKRKVRRDISGDVEKSPKCHNHTKSHFSEAQRIEIARLYQQENMRGGDIAKKLGVSPTHLNIFLGSLAGLSMPPGEITEYIDDQGRRILKCPPGFAHGAYPQRNVGGAY